MGEPVHDDAGYEEPTSEKTACNSKQRDEQPLSRNKAVKDYKTPALTLILFVALALAIQLLLWAT